MIDDMKLKEVLSNVLGVSIEEINDDSSPDSLDQWDSLSHIKLVMAIESEFEVELSPEDSMDMLSVKLQLENIKGEFTVVLSEKIEEKKSKMKISESVKIEIIRMLKKYSHKDVVEFISKKEGLSKKIVYDFCLKLKK